MKLISHRGNLTEENPERENTEPYIDEAISKGYDVEVDVRTKNGQLHFGHDTADAPTNLNWLIQRKSNLWIHAKDFETLSTLLQHTCLRVFFHEKENYTIISNGLVWAHDLKKIDELCVIPLLSKNELLKWKKVPVHGICSDFIGLYND